MKKIAVLDPETIDKIAAGEVIERPASVVKELVENAIDAGAGAVTVEIRDGGISLIRITDNGEGMEPSQVPLAFLRHATSKILRVEDLLQIASLGFRGEALSSIAAVCQVELITKTAGCETGTRYLIEGGKEKGLEEIGAPEGTTFLVRNLFFNTPARKKFLKSPVTEAGYISDLMERMALSHPDISFKFISNNQTKLHTSGNSNLKDIIYGVFGREIAANLAPVEAERDGITISGFIGKPVISRGNRNYENYFVNGRYVKSAILSRGIEEGYKTFMMQHKYPFTALHFSIPGDDLDINVHPTKMELRFSDNEGLYKFVAETVRQALTKRELIPEVTVGQKGEKPEIPEWKRPVRTPEPFEKKRRDLIREQSNYRTAPVFEKKARQPEPGGGQPEGETKKPVSYILPEDTFLPKGEKPEKIPSLKDLFAQAEAQKKSVQKPEEDRTEPIPEEHRDADRSADPEAWKEAGSPEGSKGGKDPESLKDPEELRESAKKESRKTERGEGAPSPQQMDLFEGRLLSREHIKEHRVIGQLFDTYWLVEFQQKLYIIDQHAAHEKVLYERMIRELEHKEYTSQQISPPLILTLSLQEEALLNEYLDNFTQVGFEIEPFGGREYSIRAVPGNLFGLASRELFLEMLDSLEGQTGRASAQTMNEKIASMSCKAAVKGNHRMSFSEAEALIGELLTLENPYNCPHGRPTIISMTKQELEKKFKRIV